MQIVINIPEGTKEQIIALTNAGESFPPKLQERIVRAIINGTPLPKHGDLVDRDGVNNRFNAIYDELESLSNQPTHKELLNKLSMCLDTAEPIIKDNYEEAEEELWR